MTDEEEFLIRHHSLLLLEKPQVYSGEDLINIITHIVTTAVEFHGVQNATEIKEIPWDKVILGFLISQYKKEQEND